MICDYSLKRVQKINYMEFLPSITVYGFRKRKVEIKNDFDG